MLGSGEHSTVGHFITIRHFSVKFRGSCSRLTVMCREYVTIQGQRVVLAFALL